MPPALLPGFLALRWLWVGFGWLYTGARFTGARPSNDLVLPADHRRRPPDIGSTQAFHPL